MITNDGALWQKIRMPQQPAFHPDMFAEYIPYFLRAIEAKMALWADLAKSGESFEMVLVDDGSHDATFNLLREIAAVDSRVTVVKLRRNFGQTSALAAWL